MSPLLDPTHPARVRDPFLVERLTRDAPSMLVKRFPGDVVDPNSLAPNGGLLVLARGVVDVEWSKPIGEGGGGGSAAPLRVGATSTSYGWAIGKGLSQSSHSASLNAHTRLTFFLQSQARLICSPRTRRGSKCAPSPRSPRSCYLRTW